MKRSLRSLMLFLTLGLLFVLCIPASAYSAEADQWYTQGNQLLQSRNYTQALGAYDKAIALEPGYFEAWDRKADALNRAGQYTDALAASSRSLEIRPDYVQGWINQGQILYNIGYYYEDSLQDKSKADDYYNRQLLAFDKAIELDPNNAEAWFNRGYALAGMKKYDDAILAFEKVKTLNPDYPKLNLSMKQAEVLRENATPVYQKYFVPLVILLLLGIAGAGYYYRKKIKETNAIEDPETGNRHSRRKKER